MQKLVSPGGNEVPRLFIAYVSDLPPLADQALRDLADRITLDSLALDRGFDDGGVPRHSSVQEVFRYWAEQ